MIPGDLLSAFPHRQFHTLPGLLDSWAALPNSYPNALRAMQGGSLYHFYDGLWYDPTGRRTHDLPCKRRTRYRLSQPETVFHLRLGKSKQWHVRCQRKQNRTFRYSHRYNLCGRNQCAALFVALKTSTQKCVHIRLDNSSLRKHHRPGCDRGRV